MACIEALKPPVLGTLSVDPDLRVRVPVATFPAFMPSDYAVRVQYGIGSSPPLLNSALWRTAGIAESAGSEVLTSARQAAETVWVRARGEAAGFRPSIFTTPVSIVVGSIARFNTLAINSSYRLEWTGNAFLAGVRVRYAITEGRPTDPAYSAPVDIDASLGGYQLPEAPQAGETIIAEAEAWSGFSGSSVTGTLGEIAEAVRTRTSAGGSLLILDESGGDESLELSAAAGWQVPVYTEDGLHSFLSLTIDGKAPCFEDDGSTAHIIIRG
jgi:hypothetical protein